MTLSGKFSSRTNQLTMLRNSCLAWECALQHNRIFVVKRRMLSPK